MPTEQWRCLPQPQLEPTARTTKQRDFLVNGLTEIPSYCRMDSSAHAASLCPNALVSGNIPPTPIFTRTFGIIYLIQGG